MAVEKSEKVKRLTNILKELKSLSEEGVLPASIFAQKVKEYNLTQAETQKMMEGLAKINVSLGDVDAVSEEDKIKDIVSNLKKALVKGGAVESSALYDSLSAMSLSSEEVDKIFSCLSNDGIKIIDDQEIKITYDDLIKEISLDDPVKMYLKDIGQSQLLTPEQEVELAKKILDGNEWAKKELDLFL